MKADCGSNVQNLHHILILPRYSNLYGFHTILILDRAVDTRVSLSVSLQRCHCLDL